MGDSELDSAVWKSHIAEKYTSYKKTGCTAKQSWPSMNTGWRRSNTGWAENGLREALTGRIWECQLMNYSTWDGNVHLKPRRPTVFWVASREVWPGGQERRFRPSTLLSWNPTWSTVSSSGAPNTRRTSSCWSGSRGGPRRWSERWSSTPMRTGWESWGPSACRREGSG